jgi:shikimate kinase
MASGKSTVGAILARRLDLPFVDTDERIEASFGMRIAQIFLEHGEASFRAAERALILRLASEEPSVIALGGGAFVDPLTRAGLSQRAHSIWLDPPFETMQARLAHSQERPLATSRTSEQLRALWLERRPSYAEADVRIEPSQMTPEQIVSSILEQLGRY